MMKRHVMKNSRNLKKNKDSPGCQFDQSLRKKYLIPHPMQIIDMYSKCDRQVYKPFAQFQADSLSLVHNVIVFHGGKR